MYALSSFYVCVQKIEWRAQVYAFEFCALLRFQFNCNSIMSQTCCLHDNSLWELSICLEIIWILLVMVCFFAPISLFFCSIHLFIYYFGMHNSAVAAAAVATAACWWREWWSCYIYVVVNNKFESVQIHSNIHESNLPQLNWR